MNLTLSFKQEVKKEAKPALRIARRRKGVVEFPSRDRDSLIAVTLEEAARYLGISEEKVQSLGIGLNTIELVKEKSKMVRKRKRIKCIK